MRETTVYLAGPMSSKPLFNWPAFEQGARDLRKLGYDVISPAEMDKKAGRVEVTRSLPSQGYDILDVQLAKDFDYDATLAEDLDTIDNVDEVWVLWGWQSSYGACKEALHAIEQGKSVRRAYTSAGQNSWGTKVYKEEVEECARILKKPVLDTGEKVDDSNPKDLLGVKKPQVGLVPSSALIYMAKVMELGAKKYGPANWREKKVRHTVYLDAAMRHILQALDGESTDPESGMTHEAHAACCLAIILDAKAGGNLIDDLPTPGYSARLIKELTEE